MIFNAHAQDDLNRIIRHIDHQLALGSTLEESIAKLKTIETIDADKVDYLDRLLKGESAEGIQLSPYKLTNETAMVKILKRLVSSGANVKTSLKALQVCLSVNQNNANQIWKGLNTLAIYLFVILSLAIICTSIYIIKVLPQFQDMFESMGTELPEFTQSVLNMSEWLVEWWLLIIPVVLWLVYQLFKLGKKVSALEPFDKGMKLIPGVYRLSQLHFKYLLVSYTHIFISGGLKSETAFEHALSLLGKKPNDADVESNKDGDLDDILVARRIGTLEAEIEYAFEHIEFEYISELAKLREKMMLFAQTTLAIIVGAIVIAMYLPIFQMGQVA